MSDSLRHQRLVELDELQQRLAVSRMERDRRGEKTPIEDLLAEFDALAEMVTLAPAAVTR